MTTCLSSCENAIKKFYFILMPDAQTATAKHSVHYNVCFSARWLIFLSYWSDASSEESRKESQFFPPTDEK